MQRVAYTDEDGKKYESLLPDGVDVEEAYRGVLRGPPSLKRLNLPVQIEVRLHNELLARGIFTERDARARLIEVMASLQAALMVDAHTVVNCYLNPE